MNFNSIGDMSFSLMQRSRSAALKATMIDLTQELTTGQTNDVRGRLHNDFSYLTDIDYSLARLDSFDISATEAALFSSATQQNLQQMQDVVSAVGANLLTINPTTIDIVRQQTGDEARAGLDTVLSSLNGSIGGRSLFAGTATDTGPMETANTMITALKVEVAGLVTGTDVLTAIDDWFDVGGGFKATMYSGSDDPLSPVRVGDNEQVSITLHADDAEFRSVLRNTVVAALATDPDLALGVDAQNFLLNTAGLGMLGDSQKLTGLRADVGYSEQRIEEASARNSATRTGLGLARNELLQVDPFKAASRLEDVQFQLESLYAVTVRASRLNLLSFL